MAVTTITAAGAAPAPVRNRVLIQDVAECILSFPDEYTPFVFWQGRPVQLAVNPEVGGEMLSSVRRGLRALSSQARAALVVLGDQPAISRAVVAELVLASDRRGGGIAVPTFQGKRGHPLLLSTAYRDEILRSYDAVGLRGLLKNRAGDVIEVPVSVPGILEDLDSPADYLRNCRAGRTDW